MLKGNGCVHPKKTSLQTIVVSECVLSFFVTNRNENFPTQLDGDSIDECSFEIEKCVEGKLLMRIQDLLLK